MSGNDEHTVLLIPSNTTDGSTTFVDQGIGSALHTVTGYGSNIHHEDTQKKFGTTGIQFNGTDDRLAVPYSSDFDFGSANWAVDVWCYPTANEQYNVLASSRSGAGLATNFFIYLQCAWSGAGGNIAAAVRDTDDNDLEILTTTAYTQNGWQQIMLVRDGNTMRLFKTGIQIGTLDITGKTLKTPTGIAVGTDFTNYFEGYVDEFRISLIARETSGFTPPTTAYSFDGVTCEPFVANGSMVATPEIQIPCEPFEAAGALECGSVFLGNVIECEPFVATGTLVPPSIELQVNCPPFEAIGALIATPEIQIPCPPFEAVSELVAPSIWDGTAWKAWIDANGHRLTRLYYFTLTGIEDGTTDETIPMTSWQARRRSGAPTFLSVVVPWTAACQAAIEARTNGTMQISMAFLLDGIEQYREVICQADYEEMRVDKGGKSQSISLTGHKTETFTNKTIDLMDVIYESNDNGDYRYRCASCDMYLNPGDTARYGSNEFPVDQIVLMVAAEEGGSVYETMDVEEAAT